METRLVFSAPLARQKFAPRNCTTPSACSPLETHRSSLVRSNLIFSRTGARAYTHYAYAHTGMKMPSFTGTLAKTKAESIQQTREVCMCVWARGVHACVGARQVVEEGR